MQLDFVSANPVQAGFDQDQQRQALRADQALRQVQAADLAEQRQQRMNAARALDAAIERARGRASSTGTPADMASIMEEAAQWPGLDASTRIGLMDHAATLRGHAAAREQRQQPRDVAPARGSAAVTLPPPPPATTPMPAQPLTPGGAPHPDAGGGYGDETVGGDASDQPLQVAQATQPAPATAPSPVPAPVPAGGRRQTVFSPRYIDKIVRGGSLGDPNARNPRSSAVGLGQFLEGTWLGRADAPGVAARLPGVPRELLQDAWAGNPEARRQILALRTNPNLARAGIAEYARQAAIVLQRAGFVPDDTNLALAHFLGPAGAVRYLGALRQNQNALIGGAVSRAALQANPGVFQRDGQPITVRDLYDSYVRRFSGTRDVAPVPPVETRDLSPRASPDEGPTAPTVIGAAPTIESHEDAQPIGPDRSVTRAPLPRMPGVPSLMPGRMSDEAAPPRLSPGERFARTSPWRGPGAARAPQEPPASASPQGAAPVLQSQPPTPRFTPEQIPQLRAAARERIRTNPAQRERITAALRAVGISLDDDSSQ